jgi:hypothetical protein
MPLQTIGRWAPNRALIRIPYQQMLSAPSVAALTAQNGGQDFRVRYNAEILEGSHWTGIVSVVNAPQLDELLQIEEPGTYVIKWTLVLRNFNVNQPTIPMVAITNEDGTVVHMAPITLLAGYTVPGGVIGTVTIPALITTTVAQEKIALRMSHILGTQYILEVLGANGGAAQLGSGCLSCFVEIERISETP